MDNSAPYYGLGTPTSQFVSTYFGGELRYIGGTLKSASLTGYKGALAFNNANASMNDVNVIYIKGKIIPPPED